MTVHEIDPNFPKAGWAERWEQLRLRGSFTAESVHRAKNGTTFPVEITVNHLNYGGQEYNCAFARDITDRKTLEREQKALIDSLTQASANIKVLHGLLPICSRCKKIRDDSGYWHQVESYVRKHSEADFTHGLCPGCLEQYRLEMEDM